jgi:Zn-dependent protease with chaperone function
MKQENLKIVVVQDEPGEAFKKAKSFLENNNFEIKEAAEQNNNEYFIEAHNKEKRFWHLFKGIRPQILKILFKLAVQKSNQTEIQVKTEYFKKIFLKIYSGLIFSVILIFSIFRFLNTLIQSPNTDPIIFIIFFISSLLFMTWYVFTFVSRLLLGFFDYDDFFAIFYTSINSDYIEKRVFRNRKQKIFILVTLAIFILILFSAIFTDLPSISSGLFKIAISLLLLAITSIFILYKQLNSDIYKRIAFVAHVLLGITGIIIYLHLLAFTGLFYKILEQNHAFVLSHELEIYFQNQVFMPNSAQIAISFFLASPFLSLAFFIFMFYALILNKMYLLPIEMRNYRKAQEIHDSAPALSYRTATKDSSSFSVIIFLLWLIFIFAIILGLIFCLGILEYVLLGNNPLFGFDFVAFTLTELRALFILIVHKTPLHSNLYFFRFVLFIYLLPIILLIGTQISVNIKRFCRTRAVIKTNKSDIEIQDIINTIATDIKAKISNNRVISSPSILVKSIYAGIPHNKNFILLSSSAIIKLTEKELKGVLAHEIWHIKKHTFIYRALNFLSDWILMGKGFLVSVLNPVKMEFDADDFAVSWLEKQGIDKKVYTNALRKIEISNAFCGLANIRGLGIAVPGRNGNQREERPHKNNFIQNLKLLLKLYFGDKILSYVYPTTEERIARIMSKE